MDQILTRTSKLDWLLARCKSSLKPRRLELSYVMLQTGVVPQGSPCKLFKLPPELLLEIYSHCKIADKVCLGLTCKVAANIFLSSPLELPQRASPMWKVDMNLPPSHNNDYIWPKARYNEEWACSDERKIWMALMKRLAPPKQYKRPVEWRLCLRCERYQRACMSYWDEGSNWYKQFIDTLAGDLAIYKYGHAAIHIWDNVTTSRASICPECRLRIGAYGQPDDTDTLW